MVKDRNFKFGMHAPRQSPDMTPEKILEKSWKGGVARVTWPQISWALNANRSKMAKDTNFKLGMNAVRESHNITPEKILEKGAWSGSLDPCHDNENLEIFTHNLL